MVLNGEVGVGGVAAGEWGVDLWPIVLHTKDGVRWCLKNNWWYWMSRRYRLAKVVTIGLSALSVPLGTFVGFSYGMERYWVASGALLVESLLVAFDSWLYLWILERVTRR